MKSASWPVLVVGFCLFVFVQLFGAYRLKLLLKAQKINLDFFYVLRVNFISLFSSNFLPGTVGGDAVKVFLLKRGDFNIGKLVGTIIMDRIVSLVSMSFLLITVLFVPEIAGRIDFNINMIFLITGGLILVFIFFLKYNFSQRTKKDYNFLNPLRTKISSIVSSAIEIISRWIKRPLLLLMALTLTWFSVMSSYIAVWFTSQELGINITFIDIVAVEVIVYFVSLLPISLNGLGFQEAGRVLLLSLFGVESVVALALAVLIRFYYFSTSLLGVFDTITFRLSMTKKQSGSQFKKSTDIMKN